MERCHDFFGEKKGSRFVLIATLNIRAVMFDWLIKGIGVLGLIAIIIGIIVKDRQQRDWIYIIGGVALTIYSAYLGDWIFIVLQVVFTGVAIFDLIRSPKNPSQDQKAD